MSGQVSGCDIVDEAFGDFAVELWCLAIRHIRERSGEHEGSPGLTDEGMEHLWGQREAYRSEVRIRTRAALQTLRESKEQGSA